MIYISENSQSEWEELWTHLESIEIENVFCFYRQGILDIMTTGEGGEPSQTREMAMKKNVLICRDRHRKTHIVQIEHYCPW